MIVVDKGRVGRRSLSSSSCLGHPLSLVHPYRVIADRQGGRSNDASSVNQAISFLRDWNEDSAETTAIDFPSTAVVQLSQLPREYEGESWNSHLRALQNNLRILPLTDEEGRKWQLGLRNITCSMTYKFDLTSNIIYNFLKAFSNFCLGYAFQEKSSIQIYTFNYEFQVSVPNLNILSFNEVGTK